MKTNELFARARRLEPPETLEARVMAEVRRTVEDKREAGLIAWLAWALRPSGRFVPLAAMATAFILAVRLVAPTSPGGVTAPPELESFFIETVAPVYEAPNGLAEAVEVEGDLDEFITGYLKEVFWINGGNDA